MNSQELKQRIFEHINSSKYIIQELEDHGITDFSPKKWKRTSKRKFNEFEAEHNEWLLEPCAYEDTPSPVSDINDLIGCTIRDFCHADEECIVVIITDKNDENVVTLSFTID